MNAPATGRRPDWQTFAAEGRWGDGALSVGLGAGFTVLLFLGIAWYGKVTPDAPAVEFGELTIAASPPPPDLLRVEDLSRTPPPAGMELRLPSNLKPRINVRPDTQHVYQRFEVDRVASVLVETAPQVPRRLFEDENILHTTLVWVVETDGTASHVRVLQSCGKPAVDALLIEMIQDSVFSPAMKGGRKVRMMTSQLITVKWSEGSSFHLN